MLKGDLHNQFISSGPQAYAAASKQLMYAGTHLSGRKESWALAEKQVTQIFNCRTL